MLEKDKHGVLLFDAVSLRNSIAVIIQLLLLLLLIAAIIHQT